MRADHVCDRGIVTGQDIVGRDGKTATQKYTQITQLLTVVTYTHTDTHTLTQY